jgi:hypothetical protein
MAWAREPRPLRLRPFAGAKEGTMNNAATAAIRTFLVIVRISID